MARSSQARCVVAAARSPPLSQTPSARANTAFESWPWLSFGHAPRLQCVYPLDLLANPASTALFYSIAVCDLDDLDPVSRLALVVHTEYNLASGLNLIENIAVHVCPM